MTQFDITDKVALVTGGASGLGLEYVSQLLEEGARGVTIADISKEAGQKALQDIEKKYGVGKVIFVPCNVIDKNQFEDAFEKTIEKFENIDILINNAGILNDKIWEKQISVNVNGVANGILLGIEKYIPEYKSGSEGVIVNISSVAGISPFAFFPIYSGTKFAIHGMTLSWGHPVHYARTKVRVLSLCPGGTNTSLLADLTEKYLGPEYKNPLLVKPENKKIQTTKDVAEGMINIIKKAPNGTIWVIEDGLPPFKYQLQNYHETTKEYLE